MGLPDGGRPSGGTGLFVGEGKRLMMWLVCCTSRSGCTCTVGVGMMSDRRTRIGGL